VLNKHITGRHKKASWWIGTVTALAQATEVSDNALGTWHRQALQIGAVVVWRENNDWHCGEIEDSEGRGDWDDWVQVLKFDAASKQKREQFKSNTNGGKASKPRWWKRKQGMALQCWNKRIGATKRKIRAINLRPVSAIHGRGKKWRDTCWIDEEWATMVGWSNDLKEGVLTEDARGGWSQTLLVSEPVKEEWAFEGDNELTGWATPKEDRLAEWEELTKEAKDMQDQGRKVKLLVFSDASFHEGGCGAWATYGWLILGIAGGKERKLEGAGHVHGNPRDLSSTRAEHVGAYAALRAVVEMGWQHEVIQHIDNRGVVSRMQLDAEGIEWSEDQEWAWAAYEPAEWMRANDRDIH